MLADAPRERPAGCSYLLAVRDPLKDVPNRVQQHVDAHEDQRPAQRVLEEVKELEKRVEGEEQAPQAELWQGQYTTNSHNLLSTTSHPLTVLHIRQQSEYAAGIWEARGRMKESDSPALQKATMDIETEAHCYRRLKGSFPRDWASLARCSVHSGPLMNSLRYYRWS